MSYLAVKHLHITCVILSACGFLLRGLLMWRESPWLNSRPARVLPHGVDSLLLGSALWMVWVSGQYPFVQGWLTAKVLGLLVYIGLGTLALKRGRTAAGRKAAWIGALLVLGFIISVALTKNPAGLFSFF